MEKPKLVLPTSVVKATVKNPKNLIIFSKPKTGKTSNLAQLENALIIDLEQGSDFVDAMKIKANSIADIRAIGDEIKKAKYPYNYIIIDTITKLEEMCVDLAEQMYSKTPMGSKWFEKDGGKNKYNDILALPNGAGYQWLRKAFDKATNYIKQLAPNIIWLGHVKDIVLEKKGAEFNSADLDLSGKIKRIFAADSDAIGYMYRKGNQNFLSFKTSDDVSCGSRSSHLRNKEILISEVLNSDTENEKLKTYWENVYIK